MHGATIKIVTEMFEEGKAAHQGNYKGNTLYMARKNATKFDTRRVGDAKFFV
jgi:hypothetical protein